MATLVPLESINTLPAYLANRAVNTAFAAGLPQGGGFPTIGLKGTRFVIKNEGTETPVPTLELSVILLSAKPNLDKSYYATKYDPNQTEVKSPDCFSKDGVRPDPSSTLKQAESCAGCPMNQFGSGTSADGSPSKGKACSDAKLIALFTNNGIYGFKIPPASLKAFANYVKDTSRRGIDLSTCITIIGFDANFSFPVLTFNFGGFLAEAQVNKIDQIKGSDQVLEIVGGGQPAMVSPAVASAPLVENKPVVAPAPAPDPFATVEDSTVDPFATAAPAEPEKPKRGRPTVVKAAPAPVKEELSDEDAELAALLGI